MIEFWKKSCNTERKKNDSRHRKIFFCPSLRLRNDSCYPKVLAEFLLRCVKFIWLKAKLVVVTFHSANITPLNASKAYRTVGR